MIVTILRFIKNDESFMKRSTSHKSNRRNFDHITLDEFFHTFHFKHIVQRIIDRTEIRIHFCLHVSRKKAELFSRFDRGTSKHDAFIFFSKKRRHCHCHCKIGFSSTCWSNAENNIVFSNRIDIQFLSRRAWHNGTTFRRKKNAIREKAFNIEIHIARKKRKRIFNFRSQNRVTTLQKTIELIENPLSCFNITVTSFNAKIIATNMNINSEHALKRLEMLVLGAKEIARDIIILKV